MAIYGIYDAYEVYDANDEYCEYEDAPKNERDGLYGSSNCGDEQAG